MSFLQEDALRMVVALFVAALIACTPLQGFAHGGGHSSSGSGHLTGTGHVNASSHHTNGYYRHNGTDVHPYHATNSNSTGTDNYSTKGNVNPWTGQPGTTLVDE